MLENHGNIIRTALGPDIRRSIRFDDADQALVLNVKHAYDEPWIIVDADQAREAKRIKGRNAVERIRKMYELSDDINITSPVTKALGLTGFRPNPGTGSNGVPISPSRERSSGSRPQNNNPFWTLKDDEDMDEIN